MYAGTIILLNRVFSSLFLAPQRDVPPNIRKTKPFFFQGREDCGSMLLGFPIFLLLLKNMPSPKVLFASFSKISS